MGLLAGRNGLKSVSGSDNESNLRVSWWRTNSEVKFAIPFLSCKYRKPALLNIMTMKTLSKHLSSRRIKGLFASIVENGSMVSLAGRWDRVNGAGTLQAAQEYVTAEEKKGFAMKIVETPKGNSPYSIYKRVQASVADLILGFGWRVISVAFPNKVKFAGRLRLLHRVSLFIWRLYKVHGSEQVVKFLKAAQLAVQKSIGKDKINSMKELDPKLIRSKLTGYGLPTIIPSRDRKLINGGSNSIIRFWLTIFSIYRVIDIPGELKIQTIVEAFNGDQTKYLAEVKRFNSFLWESSVSSLVNIRLALRKANLRLLETTSATHKVSWMGGFSDPLLLNCLGLTAYARNILLILGQPELVILHDSILAIGAKKLAQLQEQVDGFRSGHSVNKDKLKDHPGLSCFSHAQTGNPNGLFAGKLSIKKEAAGKLRVFAMVTVWDQSVLGPIHDMLFAFLKGLPNDGTFDQHASELRARSKAAVFGRSFGYDLSAATDRLPLSIQASFLNMVFPDLGDNWSLLLTKREYYLYLPDSSLLGFGIPNSFKSWADLAKRGGKVPNVITFEGNDVPVYYHIHITESGNIRILPWILVKYAVGQPMGALSSWAMLAVTHHLIVQYCYRNVYNVPHSLPWTKDTWYTNYEVLGDDIILFDPPVAAEYLRVMDALGVPINTSKSVCANTAVTEFAKVTSLNGANVSALSWKMFMSGNSLMGRVNIIFSLLSRGVIAKANIIPWITRSAALGPRNPGNLNPTLIALWTMLSNKGLLPLEEVLKALIDGKEKVFRFAKAILYNADSNKIKLALPHLISDGKLFLYESKRVKIIWGYELPWMKITMWKPLAVFQARRDLERDVTALATSMFKWMVPQLVDYDNLEECCVLEFDIGDFMLQDGAPVIGNDLSELGLLKNDLIALYGHLFTLLREKAEKLGRYNEPNLEMDSSIPDLVEGNKSVDRYNELLELAIRAEAKLDPDTEVIPPRLVRPTELKMIQLLSKMGNRPAFTTAVNAF